MLDTMESIYRGAAFRVRIVNSTVLYRHTVWWVQTYRLERMNWWLRFLQSLLDSGRIAGSLDAVLSMSDAPRVGSDSLSQGKEGSAGFPLFTMHTSIGHIDIPIVDSVVFGSNGNYVWDEQASNIPPQSAVCGSLEYGEREATAGGGRGRGTAATQGLHQHYRRRAGIQQTLVSERRQAATMHIHESLTKGESSQHRRISSLSDRRRGTMQSS